MSGRPCSGLGLGRRVDRSLAMTVAHLRYLDLPWLELLCLGDLEAEDAVLERGPGLVRLEAVRQGHGAAEAAAANLLEDVAALLGGALVGRLARDGHCAVLDRDVDVVRLDPRQRGLDRDRVGVRGDVQRQRGAGKAARKPLERAEVIVKEAVHRRTHGQHVPDRRRTAHESHRSYTSCVCCANLPGTLAGHERILETY